MFHNCFQQMDAYLFSDTEGGYSLRLLCLHDTVKGEVRKCKLVFMLIGKTCWRGGGKTGWSHEWMGVEIFLIFTQGYSLYMLERYLLSSVPNQDLNRPSSLLNDACNRTRLQRGADKKAQTARGPPWHLLCWNFTLTFVEGFFFFLPLTVHNCHNRGGGLRKLCVCIGSAPRRIQKGSRGRYAEIFRPVFPMCGWRRDETMTQNIKVVLEKDIVKQGS